MRLALTIVAILCGVERAFATPGHDSSMRVTAPVVHRATPPRPRPAPVRPPQFRLKRYETGRFPRPKPSRFILAHL